MHGLAHSHKRQCLPNGVPLILQAFMKRTYSAQCHNPSKTTAQPHNLLTKTRTQLPLGHRSNLSLSMVLHLYRNSNNMFVYCLPSCAFDLTGIHESHLYCTVLQPVGNNPTTLNTTISLNLQVEGCLHVCPLCFVQGGTALCDTQGAYICVRYVGTLARSCLSAARVICLLAQSCIEMQRTSRDLCLTAFQLSEPKRGLISQSLQLSYTTKIRLRKVRNFLALPRFEFAKLEAFKVLKSSHLSLKYF